MAMTCQGGCEDRAFLLVKVSGALRVLECFNHGAVALSEVLVSVLVLARVLVPECFHKVAVFGGEAVALAQLLGEVRV